MLKEFDEIVGYESIKADMEHIIDIMRNKEKYEQLGAKTPHGLFLYGEPGVGKTTMVNCFIKASGRPAFVCRKDKSDGSFVEKITDTFKQAKENAPSIVFLDDLDKFANEDDFHKDAEEYVTVQSCIDEVKNDEVFVIATANNKDCLPESLTRIGRFDRSIRVETPRGKDAEEIIKYYLSKKSNVKDVNAALVAKILNGTSCSTLETVINEAGVYAGFENKNYIDMDDIIKACLRILYEAPEVVDNADKGHINEIAYHEAGHAVIAEVLTPESVSIVSVKRHDGSTAGFTVNCLTDDYWNNMDDMENRVISILGGKAATELVYGKVDSGVSSDLRRAWDIVERFVANYAAYGFYYYHYAGYRRDASEKTLTKQDDTIQLQLQHYYDDAKKILINNREFLDKMAAFLVEKETITYNDIQQIKATCKIVR